MSAYECAYKKVAFRYHTAGKRIATSKIQVKGDEE